MSTIALHERHLLSALTIPLGQSRAMRAITDLKTHAQASSSLRRTRPTVNMEVERLGKAIPDFGACFLIVALQNSEAVFALQPRMSRRVREEPFA